MGAKTLLTVEHLDQLPETCDFSYELDQGELVEVSSATYLYNRIRRRTRSTNWPASPSSIWRQTLARCGFSSLPWRQIHVYSATAHLVILTAKDWLEDAALRPGFYARVEELFAV
jgi:hypothetical protein